MSDLLAIPATSAIVRRRLRLWPLDTVALVLVVLLVGAAGERLLWIAIGALAVVFVANLRMPSARLDPDAITIGRTRLRWSEIAVIEDVRNLRARYVRVYLPGAGQWMRIPALRTSRVRPGSRYLDGLAELTRIARASNPGIETDRQRHGPAWVYPATLAVVLAVALVIQDPIQFWLPRAQASQSPDPCASTADAGQRRDMSGKTRGPMDYDLAPGAVVDACLWTGSSSAAVVLVVIFSRDGLRNGAALAHHAFLDETSVRPAPDPGGKAETPPDLPADEWRVVGLAQPRFGIGSSQPTAAYVQARKANVLVLVVYTSRSTVLSVDGWDVVQPTNTTDISIAADFASDVLNAIVLS